MAIVHASGFRPRIYEESPWYAPIAPWLARFDALDRFPTADELSVLYHERTRDLDLRPLRFVPVGHSKPRRNGRRPIELHTLYDGRIFERGEVPTRIDDWHDLFNALAFVTFPRAKAVLNARQYAILRERIPPQATRLPNARTREQDALALFDEGGLCVAAPEPLVSALCDAPPELLKDALVHRRARAVPFGHALYEHLVAGLPCPLAAAHVVALEPDDMKGAHFLEALDVALAASLSDPRAFREPSSARGSSLEELPIDAL